MMSRFRSDDYWRPPAAIYTRLPDYGHPLTERFAFDLFYHTPFHTIPELPKGAERETWEKQPVEVRELFRERARRLMRGDLSVIPTDLPPAYGAWQAVLVLPTGEWVDAWPTVESWR